MGNTKERITILAIGDRIDYDSYKKFHRERRFISQKGFEYVTTSYRRLLSDGLPPVKTKKVIIFLFFPFVYWNKYIEHRNYKGIYGNSIFFKKFVRFWHRVENDIKRALHDREVSFINLPHLCGYYRDKLAVSRKFVRAGIPSPEMHRVSRIKEICNLLNTGHSLFLKPRYGSMGKGITFLRWSSWQTNFAFRKNRIINRYSDRGWKFRDITGNRAFLRNLLRKGILIEEKVDSLTLKNMNVDMRVYTFYNKVLYVYPRKNRIERITTNISQGATGDPRILKSLPKYIITRAKTTAVRVSKTLGLNLVGMDIMINSNLKDVCVLDINIFPGFPKRRTFNLSKNMVLELAALRDRGAISYEKGCNI